MRQQPMVTAWTVHRRWLQQFLTAASTISARSVYDVSDGPRRITTSPDLRSPTGPILDIITLSMSTAPNAFPYTSVAPNAPR